MANENKRIGYIILDTVDFNNTKFQRWLKKAEITTRIMTLHGPAGNWPEIRYTGKVKALQVMVIKWWNDASLINYIQR